MNLYMVGYSGTGKSTVAKHLGMMLGWEWLDADVEVELAAGKSIAQIFADEGEERFRDLESAVLQKLAARDKVIIALGGGAVLREANRRTIQESGQVAWLTATPAALRSRISQDATTAARRPNLTAEGGISEITAILQQRIPLYRQIADVEIDTERLSPAEVAAEILRRLPSAPR